MYVILKHWKLIGEGGDYNDGSNEDYADKYEKEDEEDDYNKIYNKLFDLCYKKIIEAPDDGLEWHQRKVLKSICKNE
jgi:hypothetical protein